MALQMTWQPNLLDQRRKNDLPLGLKNVGNSCYLNSVLQCLTYTPPLANFCLRNEHSSACDSREPGKKRECPFCVLENRIARSLSVDLNQDTPLKMTNSLRTFAEHFRLGRQEDAHEFLRYVIDACHNTCLRLKKLQQQRRKGSHGSAKEVCSGTTVVKEIFGGALHSQVKCLSCGVESNKIDEIMDLSLDVLHSSSLKESLQKFFQAEVLEGNNKYKCENCKKLVAARKQMSLHQAPNILVIQLKRFEGIYGGKIDKVIAFEEVLVLSSYMCKGSQDPYPEYKLFGTIVHSGFSPDSGHYYAYIKDAMGRWCCCNDSYVRHVNLQEVLSEKVYILFFSRTKQRPVPASTTLVSSGSVSKSRKVVDSEKALHAKLSANHLSERVNLTRTKVDKVHSKPQASLSNILDSGIKKNSTTFNGKIVVHRSQTDRKNEGLRAYVSLEKGEKNISVSNGNGVAKSYTVKAMDGEKNRVFPSANGNCKNKSTPAMSGEASTHEDGRGRNGVAVGTNKCELRNGDANCPSDISGSKRKLQDEDACILFMKNNFSRENLEEFKEVIGKEASSFLRSSGWTEEVYKSMHSRKKICSRDASGDILSDNNALKKKLITEARSIFISKIPEPLKENFIERLRSFFH